MSAQPDRTALPSRLARPLRIAGVGAAVVALTAGCAAGQVASTAEQKSSIDGINASVSTMDLRAIAIASPPSAQPYYRPGTSAELKIVLANGSRSADTLTGITTSAASGWAYYADYRKAFQRQEADSEAVTGAPSASQSAESSASPSGSASGSASRAASDSASASGSGSTTASGTGSAAEPSGSSSASGSTGARPSASASTSSAPSLGARSVTIPALGRISSGTPAATGAILLTGISKALYPAATVSVTFTFARAGKVTVAVPVQVAELGRTAAVGGEESPEG